MRTDEGGRPGGGPRGRAPVPGGRVAVRDAGAAADARLRMTFEAFCRTHERAWLGLADVRLGNRADAELVVAAVEQELQATFGYVLEQAVPAAHAWRLLNHHVADWADGHELRVEARTFAAVLTAFEELTGVTPREEADGAALYRAIMELSDRQRDVVILRHVLALDDAAIAACLDRSEGAVRSILRHARERLTRRLGTEGAPGRGGER
ncbi:sigma factor-like helix-turn-helix DNA-binding protein [Streptomyces sp. ICBB 8177]|uniref:RNA polymerase sigma factor n=1 Tax=Streptomyces sp. ICBB 8177 TaxID=563922 RepID=UPI000D6804B6|nr:sigma factor-like helix-turn-helix DNA-binding protein [Streptomyces sp. ICBB 8177]PWI44193.1 RNA polymerase subunit sigma-24 [Streptomyces sp. ICBB 8177]